MQRIAAYLRDAVPTGSRGFAALAVVPVDDPQVAAQSVVSLAVSCAQQGKQVIVADLCAGAPAARLLGAEGPGVRTVSVDGTHLVAAVPDPDRVRARRPAQARITAAAQPAVAGELAAACASADLLLTLTTLDPSVGSEHLATWAADAVVVVTAGRSSWTKIHAVGEMIRLAGTRLVSAVLVGADKTDESLGVTPTPGAGRDAVMTQGMQADAEGSFAGGPRGRRLTTPSCPGCIWTRPKRGHRGAQADEFVRCRIPHPPRGSTLEPAEARERSIRRRVGLVWGLLVLNALTYYGSALHIPHAVGKVLTQGALPVALLWR